VEEPAGLATAETICPDGCAEIVFHLGDPMYGQPRDLLVGQMDAPLTIMPTGRVAMLGARLTPTGLYRLLPVPQQRLARQVLSLDSVWSAWTRQTADRIASQPTPETQLDALERSLELLVSRSPRTEMLAIDRALWLLRPSGGHTRVTDVASACGISRRQLERRFREQVGLSPRMYARIVRFQRAFQALGHESGAAIAARCGYADQAHLVREVRRFGGQTPSDLAAADGLTTFFRSVG
jgi:AraC-like DNA-binding protein